MEAVACGDKDEIRAAIIIQNAWQLRSWPGLIGHDEVVAINPWMVLAVLSNVLIIVRTGRTWFQLAQIHWKRLIGLRSLQMIDGL